MAMKFKFFMKWNCTTVFNAVVDECSLNMKLYLISEAIDFIFAVLELNLKTHIPFNRERNFLSNLEMLKFWRFRHSMERTRDLKVNYFYTDEFIMFPRATNKLPLDRYIYCITLKFHRYRFAFAYVLPKTNIYSDNRSLDIILLE